MTTAEYWRDRAALEGERSDPEAGAFGGADKPGGTRARYWRDRAEMVMEKGMAKADVVLRDLQKMYAQAARDVQAEIDKLYRMYAQESGLSYADAQAYLNRAERTEWRMTLAEYVDRINATGDKALLAELNALAAQSRVRRFRQVHTAIDVAASELRSGGEKLTEKLLRGTYRSAYRMAGDLLAGGTLEALNPASVAQALAYPWSGASFSERIWSNAEQLAQTLRRTVTQGLIQGQDVRQMAASVQKATGSAMHRAETLIRTETARCIEGGTLAGYKAAGVERYQILVSPDSRTCDACARLDGAVFRVDEAVTGVNYPPFHPNCRDTTVPYFGDDELARWEQLGAGMAGGSGKAPESVDFLREDDIIIARSLGAKAKNYDIVDDDGTIYHFMEGTYIRDVKVFAGKGGTKPLKPEVAQGLSEQEGGDPEQWQHVKGIGMIHVGDAEAVRAEVHWFQEPSVGRVRFKIKKWLE